MEESALSCGHRPGRSLRSGGLLACVALACSAAPPRAGYEPVIVPFELRGDLALVRVSVQGKEALLILDSGSGALVLDSSFAAAAGIRMSPIAARASGSANVPIRIGTAKSVTLGGATLSNVTTAFVDLSAVQERAGYDVLGALGYELFARYVVVVDYADKRIELHEPSQFVHEGGGTVLPFKLERRLPVVQVLLETRKSGTLPARLHVDMGSTSYAIRLSARFAAAHPIADDTTSVLGPFGANVGGATTGRLLRIPGVRIGAIIMARPSVAVSQEREGVFGRSAASDGTIGAPILRRMTVVFDYSRSRIILEPRDTMQVADSSDASGLLLTTDRAGVRRVAFVIAGSAADSAGIRVGDEVLRIDERDAGSYSVNELRSAFRAAGATRRLTVRRAEETRTVTLVLRAVI